MKLEDTAGMIKEEVRRELMGCGAIAVGFSCATTVETEVNAQYEEWIASGANAGMEYLKRHIPLRKDPSSVLENVSTVISVAFSYAPSQFRRPSLPEIACYAYGKDYHDVLRKRLSQSVEKLREAYGGDWRICIDSAPLPERYWALKGGIGFKGRNGSVIVDNYGSYIFLAEVLTSLKIEPDAPSEGSCMGCGECVRHCPASALSEDGLIDARRCINYLTIEHRGEWDSLDSEIMNSGAGKNTLFGCDICQRICPHNRSVTPTAIEEFQPLPGIFQVDAEDILGMSQDDFSAFFKGSAIKRAKLAGMRRNALNVLKERGDSRESDNPREVE